MCLLICSVVSDSLGHHGLWPARLLCPWGFSRQEYWSGLPCPSPGDLPNPGIESRSPALQVDYLPSEPPGKPMNTEVGSLSLLQGIFPSQESNRDLLRCRRILYQPRHQGIPLVTTGPLWIEIREGKNLAVLVLPYISSPRTAPGQDHCSILIENPC